MVNIKTTMKRCIRDGKIMSNEKYYSLLNFQQLGDDRGHLVVIEEEKDVPFEIKRIFYIYGSDANIVRGKHANRKSTFALVNVCGKSKVKILDGKGNEQIVSLDKPNKGVVVPNMVWKEMYDFSPDSILLVLSDQKYDPSEYINDYAIYEKEVNRFA